MRSLYNLAERSVYKEFYSVRGGTHNDTFEVAGLDYYRRLRDFIYQHVQEGAIHPAAGDAASDLSGIAPAAVLHGSTSGSLDEEGYLMVDSEASPSVALPTMTKSFTVK
jgi:hypothetical protein